jgi:hypothetical protein
MGSTGKRLFINLLLLLLAGGLIWFVATREPETQEMGDRLYDATMGDNVTKVLIHVQGRPDILIENTAKKGEPDNWMITQPLQAAADEDKVQLLFTLLTDPVSASYDAADKDLVKFGLDQEKMSISFNGVKLLLGDLNQVSQTRYILKGDKIYLIAESASALMQSGLQEFKKQMP